MRKTPSVTAVHLSYNRTVTCHHIQQRNSWSCPGLQLDVPNVAPARANDQRKSRHSIVSARESRWQSRGRESLGASRLAFGRLVKGTTGSPASGRRRLLIVCRVCFVLALVLQPSLRASTPSRPAVPLRLSLIAALCARRTPTLPRAHVGCDKMGHSWRSCPPGTNLVLLILNSSPAIFRSSVTP